MDLCGRQNITSLSHVTVLPPTPMLRYKLLKVARRRTLLGLEKLSLRLERGHSHVFCE